jgi:HD-GYP domain-containing protein (c-di-GMP phosphodiesterase class II)
MTLGFYVDILSRQLEELPPARCAAELDSRAPSPEAHLIGRETLQEAMAAHDLLTYEHSERVQRWAALLARQAAISDDQLLTAIDAAALLHDVGKLGISVRLLNKPGPLTVAEYDEVKRHSTIGADALTAAGCPSLFALLVRHHHENWDGSGYPDGLEGEDIPVGSRLLAIVDCYDALTSDRPYRRALGHDNAVALIVQRRGTMYDPAITDDFLKLLWRLRSTSVTERAQKRYARAGLLPLREARAR